MIKTLIITQLFLFVSCAHRMSVPLPNLDKKKEKEQIEVYKKYKIENQSYYDMMANQIKIQDVAYDLETTKYLVNEISPKHYPRLMTTSWGKYLAYLSFIPMIIFGKRIIEIDSSLDNVSIFLLSSFGIFYGMSMELEKNNNVIDKYNQDLKIKLNIINLPIQ